MESIEWKSYEEVARYLLNQFASEFGLSHVEGKQLVAGKSGTNWAIDAKGVREGDGAIVVIESRRNTTARQSQEKIAALAWRIGDIGAAGGIIVSPLKLQKGAEKVARAGSVLHVELHQDSTSTEFCMKFLNKLFVGLHEHLTLTEKIEAEVHRTCAACGNRFLVHENEKLCSTCSS